MDGSGERSSPYPWLYHVADERASVRQRGAVSAVLLQVFAALLIALGSDLSAFLVPTAQALVAGVTAVLLLVVLAEQLRPRRTRFEQDWFRARTIAESLKTATWRYMLAVPPFEPDADADQEFERLAARFDRSLRTLGGTVGMGHADRVSPITPPMRAVRQLDWPERRAHFLAGRLHDQLGWYGQKAQVNARRSRQFAQLTIAALLVAVGLSVLHIVVAEAAFVGTFTTLAASLVAWAETRRFDELAATYRATQAELGELRARVERATSQDDFDAAVVDAEDAISREHTAWFARSARGLPPAERHEAHSQPAAG